MVKVRFLKHTNMKSSLRIWLLAGASSAVLAGLVAAVFTSTVLADAHLSRPAATLPPVVPSVSETPALLAPPPPATAKGDRLRGLASWYGGVFHGRRTASGERFDMNAMTACHPTLPFGSMVRVVNLANHRSVVVRITDRGYLYKGRIIDLSYGAAQKLAMTKSGLASVQLEVLSLGGSHPDQ